MQAAVPPSKDGAEAPAPAAPRGAPFDPGAFPPAAPPPPLAPGKVEAHGYLATWFTPWAEAAPTRPKDPFRLRFAVLRADAALSKTVTVLARVGFMQPGSPLLDLTGTYQPTPAFGVTVGQFRLPVGAAATTLAPNVVLLDRPSFVYAMTKVAFRDTGLLLHNDAAPIGGVLHYRVAVASGAGRFGAGGERPPTAIANLTLAARALLDLGPKLLGGRRRIVIGGSYVHAHDPAIATGTAAADKDIAGNTLGRTLVPFGKERETQLGGGDVTYDDGRLYARAEALYLRGRPLDGTPDRRAVGGAVEAAYAPPLLPSLFARVDVAARLEHFDPNLDQRWDEQQLASIGVNAHLRDGLRAGAFLGRTFSRDAKDHSPQAGSDLTFKAAYVF